MFALPLSRHFLQHMLLNPLYSLFAFRQSWTPAHSEEDALARWQAVDERGAQGAVTNGGRQALWETLPEETVFYSPVHGRQ